MEKQASYPATSGCDKEDIVCILWPNHILAIAQTSSISAGALSLLLWLLLPLIPHLLGIERLAKFAQSDMPHPLNVCLWYSLGKYTCDEGSIRVHDILIRCVFCGLRNIVFGGVWWLCTTTSATSTQSSTYDWVINYQLAHYRSLTSSYSPCNNNYTHANSLFVPPHTREYVCV